MPIHSLPDSARQGALRITAAIAFQACLGLGLFAADASRAAALDYQFKTIDIDKHDDTYLLDINKSGAILAWDVPASGIANCVLIQGKTRTPIFDPAGDATYCHGLNSAGTIVGYYEVDDIAHGFVYSQGVFTDFFPPDGMDGRLPIAVSDSGAIAGYYYDDNLVPYGFVLSGTSYSTFQIAGMTNVFPVGINNSGQITIQAVDTAGQLHAFLKKGAKLTELAYPGAIQTVIEKINNKGQLVGRYSDAAGAQHGFAYETGTGSYSTIDDPGAVATSLSAINDAQTLVGRHEDAVGGLQQGLKATGSLH